MRLKDYKERSGKRVWLSESEIQSVIGEAETPRQKVAFLLGARCGLRRKEIVDVRAQDIQETDTGTVVRVWDGKGEKYREPPAPQPLQSIAETLAWNMDDEERLVGTAHGSTVYRWLDRATTRLEEQTEDPGWDMVDVHDLRRSWGICVLEAGVLPSVVMEWGGWADWETFRDHYLAEFSPEALRRERQKVGFLSDTVMSEDAEASADVLSTRESKGVDR
jgi:integrase